MVCDKVWESVASSSDSVPEQLTRLEGIVADLELSIPTGTVARQFILKRVVANRKRMLSNRLTGGSGSDELDVQGDDSGQGTMEEMLVEKKWTPANFQNVERSLERWPYPSACMHACLDALLLILFSSFMDRACTHGWFSHASHGGIFLPSPLPLLFSDLFPPDVFFSSFLVAPQAPL